MIGDERRATIDTLVADLQPVTKPGRISGPCMLWLLGAIIVSAALMRWYGPFRPHAATQLLNSPQFMIETLVGLLAILSTALAAFRAAIPSPSTPILVPVLPLILCALWLGFYLYGLHSPALPISMAGKREHCIFEVLVYGLPLMLVGFALMRRLYPLRGALSGALLGLAAGAIPALLMQFACMYIPEHILSSHILPGLLLAVIGGVSGSLLLRSQ